MVVNHSCREVLLLGQDGVLQGYSKFYISRGKFFGAEVLSLRGFVAVPGVLIGIPKWS